MPGKVVERRKTERGEGAASWTEEERKSLLKLGDLIDKWQNRNGTPKKKEDKRSSLDILLGVSED